MESTNKEEIPPFYDKKEDCKIKTIEDLVMRAQELADNISCLGTLEEELLKLRCVFKCCLARKDSNGDELLDRRYVLEKLDRLFSGTPIIMDTNSAKLFMASMLKKESNT